MVHVRFLSPCCTNGPASTTNTLLQSCDCPHLFSTDFFGSSPIRVVPPSWMILPGASNPYDVSGPGIDPDTTAPISWSISRNVSCICLACSNSSLAHFSWKRINGNRKGVVDGKGGASG